MSLLSRIRMFSVVALVVSVVPLVGAQSATAASGHVVINEVRIDQPGGDDDEYVELAGIPGASLDGYALVVIGDGSRFAGSGVIESFTALDGFTIEADGLLLLAEPTFSLGTADEYVSLNFENNDNVTMLVVSGFSGALGNDLDVDDDGILDAAPWAEVIDSVALVESLASSGTERYYSSTTVGPDGVLVPSHTYRCVDGFVIGDFDPVTGTDTPGAINPCGGVVDPFGQCNDSTVPISAVQGDGRTGPLVGQGVVIEGVVIADFQSALDLFFVQEEDAHVDADPSTSEGVAVFTGSSPSTVDVGDVVRIQGTATELVDLTAISPVLRVEVCTGAGGTASPSVIHLPETDARDLEPFEGMLTSFPDELTVSDTSGLGRFGEIVLSAGGRQHSPTHLALPSAGLAEDLDGDGVPDQLEQWRILLDDLSNEPIVHGPSGLPPSVSSEGTRRVGDTVTGLTAIVDQGAGEYRLRPVGEVTFAETNPRGAAPDPGGDVTVASFNVSNFFETADAGVPACGPADDQDCRGADSAVELRRQQDKITSAIIEMNADVVGLVEIENDDAAVDRLVAGLAGYRGVDTGPIGTDAVKVAVIYRPDTVVPLGVPALLDASVDARFDDTRNRPALAQTFEHLATGDRFTVVVNHLASRANACGEAGDSSSDDGSGNCDAVRTAAVAALGDWLDTDPTGEGDGDVLIIGDLNSYAMERPVATLEAAGFTDLLEQFVPIADRYSFVLRGMSGYPDHGLANESLLPNVAGAAVWHINADEPRFNDYNDDRLDPTETSGDVNPAAAYRPDPYRSSDHDPVLVGLTMVPVDPRVMLARLVDQLEALTTRHRSVGAATRWLERTLDERFIGDGTLGHQGRVFFAFHANAARELERSSLDAATVDRVLAHLYEIDRRLVTDARATAGLGEADAMAAANHWAKALTRLGQIWMQGTGSTEVIAVAGDAGKASRRR